MTGRWNWALLAPAVLAAAVAVVVVVIAAEAHGKRRAWLTGPGES